MSDPQTHAPVHGEILTEADMLAKLQEAVTVAGSQKAWAKANGVSPQYVCDCLGGRRSIGESVALALGYRPVTAYVSAEGAP
jgi:hypothetical protein